MPPNKQYTTQKKKIATEISLPCSFASASSFKSFIYAKLYLITSFLDQPQRESQFSRLKMADPSISTTLLAQLCLCFAFYLSLNMGRSKNYDFLKIPDQNPLDFYFISVWGGLRSVKEETLLLKQVNFCVFIFIVVPTFAQILLVSSHMIA